MNIPCKSEKAKGKLNVDINTIAVLVTMVINTNETQEIL